MKITLDIPDETLCAFFDFICNNYNGVTMRGHSIGTDELFDGAVIKIGDGE